MVKLDGAALLGEEMIALCDDLSHRRVGNREACFSALMDAIVVLPAYLDRLQAGHHDLPLLLLPVINRIRSVHGAAVLHEGALFSPDLDLDLDLPELEAQDESIDRSEALPAIADRLRQQYEQALLEWFNDQGQSEFLGSLQGVCETLLRRLERHDLRRTWWIASEALQGVIDGRIRNNTHLRRLLARLHLNLKALSEGGEAAVNPDSANSLSQALLYAIALTKPGHAGLDRLRKRFQLQALMPDQDRLLKAKATVSGKDGQMYQSLGAAVRDELAMVKDVLDLELRTRKIEPDRRKLASEALLRMQDTLKMLGLNRIASNIEQLIPAFEATATFEGARQEEALLALAERILLVESDVCEQIETLGEPLPEEGATTLTGLTTFEYRKILFHLLAEILNSMHGFQEMVRRRLEGDHQSNPIGAIEEIAGALKLLGDPEAARLAGRLWQQTQVLLERVYAETALPPEVLEWFTNAVAALELYVAALRDQRGHERFAEALEANLDLLAQGAKQGGAQAAPVDPSETKAPEAGPGAPTAGPEPEIDLAIPREVMADSEQGAGISSEVVVLDQELLEVFLEEYEDVFETLQQQLPNWFSRLEDVRSLTEVRRCFHTLKGSGRMVGAFELGDFCWCIEEMLNAALEARVDALADAALEVRLAQAILPALKQRLMNQSTGLTHEVIEAIGGQARQIAEGKNADWNSLRAKLPGYLAGMLPETVAPSATKLADEAPGEDVHEVMREELHTNLVLVESLLDSVSLKRETLASEEQLRAAHSIAGILAMAPQGRDVQVAQALEAALETQRARNVPFDNEGLWSLGSCFAFLQARREQLEGDTTVEFPESEDTVLDQLVKLKAWFEAAEPMPAPTAVEPETPPTPAVPPESEVEVERDRAAEEGVVPAAAPMPPPGSGGMQDEITRIFLDEAREVLSRCDSLLNTWRDNLHTMPLVQNLQREIHTLKGGARMAGLETLGDLSHAMEEVLEQTASHRIPPSEASVQALEQGCDRLSLWVEQLGRGQVPEPGNALEAFLQQVAGLDQQESPAPAPEIVPPPTAPKVVTELPEIDAQPSGQAEEPGGRQIRVDAELLDQLIKSAGEINIFRARLERQVSNLRGNLGEFNDTISRLREQFRKLEMETEAQILSRFHDAKPSDDETFDPLELDRFSSMQQLSRGLSESVTDLLNLEELLEESARQADTLLTQQSRVSTELQEGLMQTRMVPFGSIAPRLRRLVRAATSEVGKKARLRLQMAGASDQLDRNVLDHVTAPLEHMLRNAIVHGIEDPATRKSLGKEETGDISITVESEATEFVIQVEDDGAGINREAIRQAAIARGLIEKDANPPPAQLFELILASGFTTSATVTGLAGRGVGMDVVRNEISQIGGSLEIQSEEGQGSRFIIRIPFTLAVMQAIGVSAGDQRYFIPLASVAGVARITPEEYRNLLQAERPTYRFADQDYPILELEPLLGEPARALGNDNISLLVIRAGDQAAAFRVPELLGHREVVIKPVGPQITSVPGILGGTVTGDGRVVVILDPGPIIRQAMLHGVRPVIPERQAQHVSLRKVAMVVDDSITMRKVNSRVLESVGIEAITAKDGQDAVEQLQDRIPNIMLLDVEMPRMDGYQLAKYVRSDARLRQVPIIMITSRSGQKHRDRAMQAGANAYLTKPYREPDLIETVNRLLAGREQATDE
jgi:chemosensory pili system protein ChpA (sensor histidine kinase/response regulator)